MSEIDKRIHEWMGFCWHEYSMASDEEFGDVPTCSKCQAINLCRLDEAAMDNPAYSSSLPDAFAVVERLREMGWRVETDTFQWQGKDRVEVTVRRWVVRRFAGVWDSLARIQLEGPVADTLPLAIAQAALRVIEQENK